MRMTDDEKAALEWLESTASAWRGHQHDVRCRATIKRMLAEPRLPEELPQDAVDAMWRAADCVCMCAPKCGGTAGETIRRIHRALYAHLTKPRTKMVWRIRQGDQRGDFANLDDAVAYLREASPGAMLYQHEVPA